MFQAKKTSKDDESSDRKKLMKTALILLEDIDLVFDDDDNMGPISDIQHKQEKLKKEINKINFTFQTLEINVPANLLAMLPFVLAIIAMIVLTSGKRARLLGAPAALGIPYFREER